MIRKQTFLFLIALVAIVISCSSHEEPLTKANAMQKFMEMSPEAGARYYVENRDMYPFLDTFYIDSVFPAVPMCGYRELKGVALALHYTPLYGIISDYLQEVRIDYLQKLQVETLENSKLYKQLFETEVMPLMEIELDSMLNADVGNLMEEYAGGFFNYKKLNFFLEEDNEKFKELWEENIHPNLYSELIGRYVNMYLDSVAEYQRKYFYDLTGQNIKNNMEVQVPKILINISKDLLKYVNEFTSGEIKGMTVEFVKDYALPTALAMATGGVSKIYEIGSTIYDVGTVYDDIKNQKIEPEERLISICVNELNSKIENDCLHRIKQAVMDEIDKSSKRMFDLIKMAL